MASIEFKRRLRWADADGAGRLHFPRIFEIVEEAETELIRGVGCLKHSDRHEYDFPCVNINGNFHRIIMLDAPFRMTFKVGKLGRTSIRYDYQVFDEADELAIDGTMTVVVMSKGKSVEIPESLRDLLRRDFGVSE